MPEVSVIIPFYNRLDWVKEAIESVLNQTYPDYEVILVDDGSSEDTTSLDPFLKQDNISIYKQSNRGPAAARNLGIQRAKGIYIAFLDSDDLFISEKLAIQVQLMQEHPDVLLTHTSYQRIGLRGEALEVVHSGIFSGDVYPDIYNGCPIATPTVMVKKNVFEKIPGFNEDLRIAEDVLLWAEVSRLGPIIGIDKPLTQGRMHGQNSAMDYKAQIVGESNIIRYGLLNNRNIDWYQRRKILSIKYLNLTGYYYYYKDYKNVLRNITFSLFYHPRRGMGFVFHQIIPVSKAILWRLFKQKHHSSMDRNSLVK
jgi:glycosyltransferase involved in cell wall biosynthesis